MSRHTENLKSRKNTKMSREKRQKELLLIGVDMFANRGILRATHADIASEAGLSVPTVFSYFNSRSTLVDSVLTEVDSFFITLLKNSAKHNHSLLARDRVINMVKDCVDVRYSNPSYIVVLIAWSAMIYDPVWNKFQKFFEKAIRIFSRELELGKGDGSVPMTLDTKEAATIIVGETNMIAMMAFSVRKKQKLELFVSHYVDAALNFQKSSSASE